METEEKKKEQKEPTKEKQTLTNEQLEKVTGGYITPNKDKATK